MLVMPTWPAGELYANRPWPGVRTLDLCMEASAFLVCDVENPSNPELCRHGASKQRWGRM